MSHEVALAHNEPGIFIYSVFKFSREPSKYNSSFIFKLHSDGRGQNTGGRGRNYFIEKREDRNKPSLLTNLTQHRIRNS